MLLFRDVTYSKREAPIVYGNSVQSVKLPLQQTHRVMRNNLNNK